MNKKEGEFTFPKGSQWRKWDLHVHTPASYENSFENWDSYVKLLREQAITHEISVAGITDYFSVEGYEKLLTGYADEKYPYPALELQNGRYLYLMPSVELRLGELPRDREAINLHVLFDPKLKPNNIRINFLENLPITYRGTEYKCKKDHLIKIGHAEINDSRVNGNLDTNYSDRNESKYIKKALEMITVYSMDLEETLNQVNEAMNDQNLDKDYLILSAKKGHGSINSFDWSPEFVNGDNLGREGNTKQTILKHTDICFSNEESDRRFLLGENEDAPLAEIKTRFEGPIPCIWGSDAHSEETLFHPSQGNTRDYTWIKANPTFRGLRQITYEPDERVRVRQSKPQKREPYLVIDQVKFVGEAEEEIFPKTPIKFNPYLTSIIGGKSTGKSLLIHYIAKAISKQEANERLKDLDQIGGYDLVEENNLNFEVTWGDGEKLVLNRSQNSSSRKVFYIPQTYINNLSEGEEGKGDINNFILNIVKQDESLDTFYTKRKEEIKTISKHIQNRINELIQTDQEVEQLKEKRREIGDLEGIEKYIKELKEEVQKLQEESDFSEKQHKKIDKLEQRLQKKKEEKETLEGDFKTVEKFLTAIESEVEDIVSSRRETVDLISNEKIKSSFKNELDFLMDLEDRLERSRLRLYQFIANQINTAKDKRRMIAKKLDPLKDVQKLSTEYEDKKQKINEEKEKLGEVNDYNDKIDIKKEKAQRKLAKIFDDYQKIFQKYQDIIEKFEDSQDVFSDIDIEFKIGFHENQFNEKTFDKFLNKNDLKQEMENFGFLFENNSLSFSFDASEHVDFIKKLFKRVRKEEIDTKKGVSTPEALKSILTDFFFVDTKISYKNDNLNNMSPGKKGLVLLKILIELTKDKYPILIDQPEDDLDNRSVYTELVDFIKEKKKDRQIIMVTHNPNLAVGADSEEVLIANQAGQDNARKNKKYRFEYVAGGLENSFENSEQGNILWSQGIREHVCEILEGGKTAFEEREEKYSF